MLTLFLGKPAPRREVSRPPLQFEKGQMVSPQTYFQNVQGLPTSRCRLIILHRCPLGLEKKRFKATRLAPTRFSGRFPQSTKDSEASKHRHGIPVHRAPRESRSRWQRTLLIQKRNHQTFQTPERTKEPLFCHIQMKPRMTRGTNSNDYSFVYFFSLFPFSVFFSFSF